MVATTFSYRSSRTGGTIAGPAAWIWPAGSFATRSAADPWGRQILSRPNTTTLPDAAALGLATDFWVMTFSWNLKGGRRPPWFHFSLTAVTLRPDLPVAGNAPSAERSCVIYSCNMHYTQPI